MSLEIRVKKCNSQLHRDPYQSITATLKPLLLSAVPFHSPAASGSNQSIGPREHLRTGTLLGSQGAKGRNFFLFSSYKYPMEITRISAGRLRERSGKAVKALWEYNSIFYITDFREI